VGDPSVLKDENDYRLLGNYVSCFLGLADTLRRAKQYEEAIEVANRVSELLPYDWKPYAYLLQLYAESEQPDDSVLRVIQRAEEVVQGSKALAEQELIERLYFNLGYTYRQRGQTQKAIDSMNKILSINKSFKQAFEALVGIYYAQKDKESLTELLETWIMNNPEDSLRVSNMLSQLKSPDFQFMENPQ
jgi:tetratricopeptide (TPR) repeat protein